jgi:hypothetical protein
MDRFAEGEEATLRVAKENCRAARLGAPDSMMVEMPGRCEDRSIPHMAGTAPARLGMSG